MHETAVTKAILDIVMRNAQANNAKKVVTVRLEIGELSDMTEQWIQCYFDYFAKGTIAEGAHLVITRKPVLLECGGCKSRYPIKMLNIDKAECPECGGKKARMIAGNEYYIQGIEIV